MENSSQGSTASSGSEWLVNNHDAIVVYLDDNNNEEGSVTMEKNETEVHVENEDIPFSFLQPHPEFEQLSKKTRSNSLEIIVPKADCTSRKSTLLTATINLIATIVGGGVLSLPISFQQSGLILGTLLMIFAAIVTDFSLYILVSCARRTGARSYGAVARHAFGPGLELFTTVVLFVFLMFVLVAFMVLIKDIWTPIILSAVRSFVFNNEQGEGKDGSDEDGWQPYANADSLVLLSIITCMSPFLLRHNLHALRHNCYVGFCSVTCLLFALVYRAYQKNVSQPELFSSNIVYFTNNFGSVLFSFPIVTLAFLCSFNIISVHSSLVNPTRERLRAVIHRAVFGCFVLMYTFGVAGYLYSYNDTNGNILLNFDPSDRVILLGRVGCGITMMLAMPMVTLPCREAMLSLPDQYEEWRSGGGAFNLSSLDNADAAEDSSGHQALGETTPLKTKVINHPKHHQHNNVTITLSPQTQTGKPHLVINSAHPDKKTPFEKIVHRGITLFIVTLCFIASVAVPGVAVVWSICGSSLGFFVGFILPAACYIKIRSKRKGHGNSRVICAWALLLISCIATVACTWWTVVSLMH